MPTFAEAESFANDWKKLSKAEQALFLAAVKLLVEDLKRKQQPRKSLRVKGVQGKKGVFEMTWSMGEHDGRATFQYGEEIIEGEAHVIWRRIGNHGVFKDA